MANNNSAAPRMIYHEDFLMGASDTPLEPFTYTETSDSTNATGAPVANAANGQYALTMTSDNEVQVLTAHFGDQLVIPATAAPVFECRIKIDAAMSANSLFVCGLAAAQNDDEDAITDAAWFKMVGADLALVIEADDSTNNTDDQATGVSLVADTFATLKVDMTNTDAIKFIVDGALVGTISASAFASTDLLQPFIQLRKASSTDTAVLTFDYIHVEWNRS